VVCGPGGVGKTTTAASLALLAALDGRRRVLACTIDPSRRLATSLGLRRLSDRPRRLDLSALAPEAKGALWAMTLDTKRTFDTLVERHAGDLAAQRRILDNPFYRQVSAALSGSHEYMAMEKLLELEADRRFDLVVLDTPPTRHALDFLEAPDRMLGFLDTSILRYFVRPYFRAGRLTLKVATRSGSIALKMADRFLGLQFLQDLSEFFLAFDGMYDGFKERAGRVRALLQAEVSGFVLVASPTHAAVDEAHYFYDRLADRRMPFVGFVANRVLRDPALEKGVPPLGPTPPVSAELRELLLTTFREQQKLARIERRCLARLEVDSRSPVVQVPELDRDVHDLRGLLEFARALVPETVSRPQRPAVRGRQRGRG
jgi:anion-transporting  ArsA/GET3 family ATPase